MQQLYNKIATPNQVFTVVLGISGSGKSSLVKAGLIPLLKDTSNQKILEALLVRVYFLPPLIKAFPQIIPYFLLVSSKFLPINYDHQWEILTPMRPGESPFLSLARTILPIANVSVPTELAELNFITEVLQEKIKLLKTELSQSKRMKKKANTQTYCKKKQINLVNLQKFGIAMVNKQSCYC